MKEIHPLMRRLGMLPSFWLGRAAVADNPQRCALYENIAEQVAKGRGLPREAAELLQPMVG